jgi:hypothetical protein
MKNALVIWLWLCAYLNCAGWFLSVIHELNAAGYVVVLVLGIAAFFLFKNFLLPPDSSGSHSNFSWEKLSTRFKKPFPFAYLILSVMIVIGGVLYAPNNYDGLAYRLPRVLHWLAAGQWHWVHTDFPRLNNRACGIEWLSAPFLAVLKTDRLLFLINVISFLFLPGLIFSVLTRLGVRRKVAWYWMWITPGAYCFIIQAGGIANDSFAAPFALAAIDFALRAKISKRPIDLFNSLLAVALLTSAKTGNITLLLPWAIAILPSLKIFLQRPLATAVVCVLAVYSSFLPSAVLNQYYCHDWSGLSLEGNQAHGNAVVRVGANMALLGVINLAPPVFPEANRWNAFVQKKLPPSLKSLLQQTLAEPEAIKLSAQEMQIEENAGLGFGVTILLLISVAAVVVLSPKSLFPIQFHSPEATWRAALVISPWISLLALLSKSEVYAIGRIIAPFYPLLLPLLLAAPAHESLVKKIWWRLAAFITFAMAAGLLIILPARPLFPATTIFQKLHARHPDSQLLARTAEVYTVYHNRNHGFAPVLDILPPGLKVLGFITYDDPETSLWFPLGSRTVFHVRPDDSPAYLKGHGVEYILANSDKFNRQFPGLDEWLKNMNANVVQTITLDLRAAEGPTPWYLIKLN